jgi:hypothetical protein
LRPFPALNLWVEFFAKKAGNDFKNPRGSNRRLVTYQEVTPKSSVFSEAIQHLSFGFEETVSDSDASENAAS